jgi:hypothetical protein
MRRRLGQMRDLADVIIVDGPAVLAAADATILGTLCTGIILIVEAGRTRRDTALQAKAIFDQVGLKIQGVVLNRHRGATGVYHHYAGATTSLTAVDVVSPMGPDLAVAHRPCPFVGLRGDPTSIIMGASIQHRCFAGRNPQTIAQDHQSQVCLGGTFDRCPRFLARTKPVMQPSTVSAKAVAAEGGDDSRHR